MERRSQRDKLAEHRVEAALARRGAEFILTTSSDIGL